MSNVEWAVSQTDNLVILMASHNGGKYLGEQIDSILQQTETNTKLIICDDASTDTSPIILQRYADMYPEQVRFFSNISPSGSAKANFLRMLQFAQNSEYAMFSDQDDLWLPDKISILMDQMREAEGICGRKVPLLVYSDMQVVDENLKLISNSFMRYQGYQEKSATLNRLLAGNCITGCAMLWNKALTDAAMSVSYDSVVLSKIRMHDYWLSLIAVSLGKVIYVDKPTVMYRQHDSNSVGALGKNNIPKRLKRQITIRDRIKLGYTQAQLLLDTFGNQMSKESISCINQFLNIASSNIVRRTIIILKGKYLRESPLQAIIHFLALIAFSPKAPADCH